MICKKCGGEINVGEKFCQRCGNPVEMQQQTDFNYNTGAYNPNAYSAQPNNINAAYNNRNKFNVNDIPLEYKPISMWGYFGYEILFSIPVVGFILLLVFAFGGTQNINLKNFARSYFCFLIIVVVLLIIIVAIAGGLAATSGVMNY